MDLNSKLEMWAQLLRGGADLLDNAEKRREFRQRFGEAGIESLCSLLSKRGVSPEIVAFIRREAGV